MTAPLRHHEWVTPTPAPTSVPEAALQHLRIKSLQAEVRHYEGKRRDAELQKQLDQVAARVAELEYPATDDEPADTEPGMTLIPSNDDGPGLAGPDDVAWVIDGWRERGWTT